MSINVALDTFEGPLALLIELVRRSEISVWEIRIQSICDQFIAYTRQLESIDVDMAGDFLVMAATLIRIKARLLLPRPNSEVEVEEEPIYEEERLITRLLLYEGFREAADELEQMARESQAQYTRGQVEEIPTLAPEDPLEGVSLLTLALLAEKAYKQAAPPPTLQIQAESHTISGQMAYIRLRLTENSRLAFWELLSDKAIREEVVTTFLAILELVRLQEIAVWQANIRSDVIITRRDIHGAVEAGG